jgi:hypothetical protein
MPTIHAAAAKLLVEEKNVVPTKHSTDAAFFNYNGSMQIQNIAVYALT